MEEVVHAVEDKTCDKCGSEMVVIGKEKIRDEVVYVPARLFLRRHYAEAVKCTCCGRDESRNAELPEIEQCRIRRAEVPAPMILHSFCSPELLAHIVYEKYCNAMPLYRLEKDFTAEGMYLSRATMANWILYAAEMWVKPVWERMKEELLTSPVIHADETVVQVLREPNKKAKTESRMWVYCNGKMNDRSNILFEYQPTRNGDHAAKFLGDYNGYLVCDGYKGYNKMKMVKRCGCFSHVRRKFADALPTDKTLLPTSLATKGLEYCNALFLLEREYAEMTPEEILRKRQEEMKPVLDEFFAWAEGVVVAEKTKLSAAVNYAKSEKKYLYRFLESPDVPMDNNRAENAIRPFCVRRKNWLFSTSPKGARASGMMYSAAATACANGMDVERYFTELFQGEGGSVRLPW